MNQPNESSLCNSGDTSIRISSENVSTSSASPETRVNDITSNPQHTINIDVNTATSSTLPTAQSNFLSFLDEARNHIGSRQNSIQAAVNGDHTQHEHRLQPEDSNRNHWGVNLINNVFSFSASPSTETIRSWIPRRGAFSYASPQELWASANVAQDVSAPATPDAEPVNDVVINLSTTAAGRSENNPSTSRPRSLNSLVASLSRANYTGLPGGPPNGDGNGETNTEAAPSTSQASTRGGTQRIPPTPPPRNVTDVDEDNLVNELAVKILSHFVRYLPFIGIVLLKSIYDHWLGIVDILFLHMVVYQINKSLCEQVAKMSQKSYGLLFRDYLLVTFVIVYRFLMAHSQPDWFGLLLNTADDQHSLSQLLHAVAVNDLILKLITINVKIFVTALPVDIIKHRPRGRFLALIEAISQMYRSLVPVKSWLLYLLVSYSGLDIIVGMFFFSLLYMGAKAFEFIERGKFLKKSFCNFLRNVDYGRQPTKNELNEAGNLCPICHDSYDTPVVLECNHVFCEVCVGTWFKREQTCPMCRAKVADDPTWQNGATTLFYQLC